MVLGLADLKVSSFIIPSIRAWDSVQIEAVFNERDQGHIYQIPLSQVCLEDCWQLVFNRKGSYTVKSAYAWLCRDQAIEHSMLGPAFWNQLWKSSIPPKLKIWCGVYVAVDFWLAVLPKACGISAQGSIGSSPALQADTVDSNSVWFKPRPGFVKCNCDAAIFQHSDCIGGGWVIRDEEGQLVNACHICLCGPNDSAVAEALSFREVLSWVKRNKLYNVILELDSLQLVKAIQCCWVNASYFGSLVAYCISLLNELSGTFTCFYS
ncbi:hypothetical protein GH714_037997 [Hevea brasiliensis]|uniref:RNase H type-1 domain-containing protein n=1 Tax=Hevea brasiliensis TaxID=3981 RepID=A0A6A6LWP8_HEVBR|nr:hypothetical protein GH714_037997 [Hevea brasiliensis]